MDLHDKELENLKNIYLGIILIPLILLKIGIYLEKSSHRYLKKIAKSETKSLLNVVASVYSG